jgi:hypothetical protein
MKILLTLFLFIPTLLYSQRIEEVDGKYRAKIEYSVSDKNVDYIFTNANSWIEMEFQKKKMNAVTIYMKSKKISGMVYDRNLSFNIEIVCSDGSFITRFSDFKFKGKPIKPNRVDKVNRYLFELSGRMQKYIRYGS